MRAEAPFSLPELVRSEIAADLRKYGCSLAALTVERNLNALTAEATASDLERMRRRAVSGTSLGWTSTGAFLRATAEAVKAFANGDVNGAVAILAEPCGLSAEEWIAEARRERGL
jgi:hypothetical protein